MRAFLLALFLIIAMLKPPLLLLDNYDSFTHILAHYLEEVYQGPVVVRANDAVEVAAVADLGPVALVISPGPGRPENGGDIGHLQAVFAFCQDKMPVLGVCLGHQFIAHFFGGRIVNAPVIMHGKTDEIRNDGSGLFQGLPALFTVMRYHSLLVADEQFPSCLSVCARSERGEIMALRHKERPIFGVQFHPESMASEWGRELLANFCAQISLSVKAQR